MAQIDFSQMVTRQARQAAEAEARAVRIKADCARRITAVLDQITVLNIQGAVLANELDPAQVETFRAGRVWIAAMQAASRQAITEGTEPDWPVPPDGVAALAQIF